MVHLKGVERAVHTLKVHEHELQEEEGATIKMIHLIAGLDTIFDEIHRVSMEWKLYSILNRLHLFW